jgi:hypothetical protein
MFVVREVVFSFSIDVAVAAITRQHQYEIRSLTREADATDQLSSDVKRQRCRHASVNKMRELVEIFGVPKLNES